MPLDPSESTASFAGRDAELRVLRAALERARSGHGGFVAIAGEAGIGKTRLVEELLRGAGDDATPRVLWGRCPEQPGSPSYWPWSRVLRAHAAARGLERLREELGSSATVLAPLLPGLAPEARAPAEALGTDCGTRFALFEAVAEVLRQAAADEPLVVVLEDLHWADEASLALLELLVGEIEDSSLLLIATFRDRERTRLPRPLVEAARRGRRIALDGLDRDAIAQVASRAVGSPAPDALVDRLAETTAGNPFFLGELLGSLARDGRLGDSFDPSRPLLLPDTVRDSIRRRLEDLATEEREVLALAAVVGQEFDVGLLQEASGEDATVVLQRLHGAIAAGLIREGVPGRFRFAHALLRETLYVDLLPARRVHLHADVGRALERLHGDDHAAPLGALASHFLHAAPLGTAPKAAAYARRAAEQALGLYAYQDALRLYEQAITALGAAPTDRGERLTLRLAAADAARRAGHDRHARRLLLETAQDARALGASDALAVAAMGYYLLRPNIAEPDADTIPLLEEALQSLPTADGTERATLLALLAAARFSVEASEEHARLGRDAIAMARRVGDARVLALALLAHQLAVVGPGSTASRLALADEALALTEGLDPELEHVARGGRTHCFLERGDVAAAAAEVELMARLADRTRQPERQWQVAVRRASIALLEGRFDDGARLAAEALAVRRNGGDSLALQVFVLQMFLARRDTGQHGGLEGSLRWMVEHTAETRAWTCVLMVFLADVGRVEETRTLFERLAADGFARLRDYQNHQAALAWLARVCRFLGDKARAEQLYPLLLPYADINITLGADAQACLGSTHRYLGLLAATLERHDDAERHFQAAIAMNQRMGARPVLACCEHEYARVLEARDAAGDRTLARQLLARARETAEVCGLTQLLGWIEYLGPIADGDTAIGSGVAPDPVAPVGPEPAASPEVPRTAADGRRGVLRRDGDLWEVGFAGETVRMKDTRGLQLLAALLRLPGQEVHVLDLAAGPAEADGAATALDRGDAGPMLDAAARAAYRSRLEDLRDEIDEAERFHDPDRAARARQEVEFLADELARGVGLGGRERRAASAAERARVNASRTISAAIRRITELSPALGEHLRACVRTGYLCSYAPAPGNAIAWEL